MLVQVYFLVGGQWRRLVKVSVDGVWRRMLEYIIYLWTWRVLVFGGR